jgi:hypothetical protein
MEKLNGIGTVSYKEEFMLKGNFDVEVNLSDVWNKRKDFFNMEIEALEVKSIYDLPFSPWEFKGETKCGRTITALNMALTQRRERFNEVGTHFELGFNISELTIGSIDHSDKFQFLIPNFLIGYDHMTKEGKRHIRNLTTLRFEYKDNAYLLKMLGVNESSTNAKSIIEKNVDIITVQIDISRENGKIKFEEASEVVELFLELCTIAYGGRINWTTCLGFSNNEVVFSRIRDVPISSLKSSRQLIRVGHPFYLSKFLGESFKIYSELTKDKRVNLMKLVEGIHFSALKLTFPAPFVILGSVIEEFAGAELEEKSTYFINKGSRKELFPKFKSFIEEYILDLLEESDKSYFEETELKQKLSGLLQRNLRTRISNLLDSFQFEYDKEWVRLFVKKRNDAAHGNYTFTVEDYYTWSKMGALLEKAVLTKLQYKGEYFDWSTSPPSWKV